MQKSPILAFVFLTYALGCAVIVFTLEQCHLVKQPVRVAKPDFSQIEDTDLRKQAFFEFLTPMVQDQNQRILELRDRLESIAAELAETGHLSRRSQYYLTVLRHDYLLDEETLDLDNEALIKRLLRRIDIVPIPLALAQAASESGWGTSRFAQSANNFFGQWCYVEGCGMVPNQRASDAQHEVAKFSSVRDSVSAYFFNLNTYYPYQDFRARREQVRATGSRPTTGDLLPTLINYSERREAYLEDIRQIIAINDLNRFAQSE